MELVIVLVVLAGLIAWAMSRRIERTRTDDELADRLADARRWVDRLSGQVLNLTGTDAASTQALADAAERLTAAGSQLESAKTAVQAGLVRESALEGMYYVRAARTAMGIDPGPPLPALEGQADAGQVSESRTVEVEGRTVTAAPVPSAQTPNYYPGGQVAGRPVPAGWYSEPWWAPALRAGMWGLGSVAMFNLMFAGMSGVGYDGQAFEAGYGQGLADAGADGFDGGTGDADGFDGAGDGGFDGGDFGGGGGFDAGGFGDFGF